MNYHQDLIQNGRIHTIQHESFCCFRVSDTLFMLHSTASFQCRALPLCLLRLAAKPRLQTPSLPPLFSYVIPTGTLQLNCKPLPAHQPSSIADNPRQELFPGRKATFFYLEFLVYAQPHTFLFSPVSCSSLRKKPFPPSHICPSLYRHSVILLLYSGFLSSFFLIKQSVVKEMDVIFLSLLFYCAAKNG